MTDRIRAQAAVRIERTIIAHCDRTTATMAKETIPVMEEFLAFSRQLRQEPGAFGTNPSNREVVRRSDGAVMGGLRGFGLWGFRTGGEDPSYVGLEIDVPGLRLSGPDDQGDTNSDTIAIGLTVLRRIADADRTIRLDELDVVTRTAHGSLPIPDGPRPASVLGDGRDVVLAGPWTRARHEPMILPPMTRDPEDDPFWAIRRDVPFLTVRFVLGRLVLGAHRILVEKEGTPVDRLRLHAEARTVRRRIAEWGSDGTADGQSHGELPPCDDDAPDDEGPRA